MPLYQDFAIRSVVNTLTGMQRAFVEHLLTDPKQNATKAAEKAGYSNPDKAGPRLRREAKIAAAIEEILHQQTMSRNEVLARLSQQASAEYAQYIKKDGRIDLAAMKANSDMHLIRSVRVIPGGEFHNEEIEVTFHDAQTALVWLGRYYGLFSDKTARDNDNQTAISDALAEIANEYGLKLQ